MEYSVVPFLANIQIDDDTAVVASQLARLINEKAAGGWKYVRMESVETIINDPGKPGSSGCFGLGAEPGIPPSQKVTRFDLVVFEKSA